MTLLIIGGLLYFYFHLSNNSFQPANTSVTGTITNPFGTNTASGTNTDITNTSSSTQNTAIKNTAQLIEIYKNPVSGSVFFTNKNNQDDVRFIDRGNGNVYEYLPTSQTGQATRLTNTTIPKVQEAIWSNNGSNVFLRYLDTVGNLASFAATVNVNAGTSTDGSLGNISGAFITSNIQELVTNPKGNQIFALLQNNVGSYGFTGLLDGSSKKQIFNSPISLWNISWPSTNTITFTTKPTYANYGFLYFFNTQTQSMDRILGDIPGLSTVTNNGANLVAYSESQNNSFNLDIYDVKNKTNEGYKITTLADKCIWGNTDNTVLYCAVPQIIPLDTYPDAWYQGTESFSDSIWMINTTTGTTNLLYQIGLKENVSIDAMNLQLSPDDKYLVFQNKNDLSLWLLTINQ
jgi:hypothetical protein